MRYSLLCILLNPVSCGADGLLGDAHDAAHVLVFHAHFVEDEEEGVMCGLGQIFLLDYFTSKISPRFFSDTIEMVESEASALRR